MVKKEKWQKEIKKKRNYDITHKVMRVQAGDYAMLMELSRSAGIPIAEALHTLIINLTIQEGILRRKTANTDISKALDFLNGKLKIDHELLPPDDWLYYLDLLFDLILRNQPVSKAMRRAFLFGAAWSKYSTEFPSEKGES